MSDPGLLLLKLFTPEYRANPYPLYAQLREAGSVIKSPMGSWIITRYETVDRVLRSPAFRTPRGYRDANDPAGPPRFDINSPLGTHRKHWLLFQSGEAHTRLRKLIMAVFTPRAVRALAPRIDALVDELLIPIRERGSMEVIADLAYPLPATVICELLGIPAADRDLNRKWAASMAATVDPTATDAQIKAASDVMNEWDPYIRALLADKRKRADADAGLLDAMLAVEAEGARLTEDEIAANATFLFLAGHETTTNLIGNGLYGLLKSPAQLEALRANVATPGVIDNAIEELLRFDSPVQFAPRVAIEPIEIEGVQIAKELPLLVALGCANHDPLRFERPDELDIARPDPKPLSFGGGPHYCVGAALARLEAIAAFKKLVEQTRSLELEREPAWRPSLTLRSLQSLEVKLA